MFVFFLLFMVLLPSKHRLFEKKNFCRFRSQTGILKVSTLYIVFFRTLLPSIAVGSDLTKRSVYARSKFCSFPGVCAVFNVINVIKNTNFENVYFPSFRQRCSDHLFIKCYFFPTQKKL